MSGQWTVQVDQKRCIGNAMCAAAAPEVFELVDGKSVPKMPQVSPSDDVVDAFESCPVAAIALLDDQGEDVQID